MSKSGVKKQKKSASSKTTNVMNVVKNNQSNINTPEVCMYIEKITNNESDNENSKIISYTKVKEVLDMFTNSFIEYGKHLYSKYNQEKDNALYEKLMKKSYLRNVRFVLNPTWPDMNKTDGFNYPNCNTYDNINSLFYMISEEKRNSWLFQSVQTFREDMSDELIMEAFNALLSGLYHEQFMNNNDRVYYYFTYYMDMLKCILDKESRNYTQNIYHIGSLLQINDGVSSLYQPYTNVENCVATKNLVMAISSLTTLKNNNILRAMTLIGLEDDIKMYINCVLTPFFGIFYAFHYLDMEKDLISIEFLTYNSKSFSKPHSSWIDEEELEFNEEKYKKEREEITKLENAKRAIEKERRKAVNNSTPANDFHTPQILNKQFVQKLEENKAAAATASVKYSPTASDNSRASAFMSETTSNTIHSPTTTEVSDNTNKRTYVPYDFVFDENSIPRSLMRKEKNETIGRDTGFLIFHAGTAPEHVYERAAVATHSGRYKCAIKNVCAELPRFLVEKERFLRKSRDKVFGKSLEELFRYDIENRKFYYTNLRRAIISFCNEIAATHRFDNAGRMTIVEKYYGPRRDSETEKMYIDSFMIDVFRPFINFYNYAKTL